LKPKEKNKAPTPVEAQRELAAQVVRMVTPICSAQGCELVHCEFRREPAGLVLRLYIDKPGGVGLADCVGVSRQVSDLLDAGLDEAVGPYNLEVSSPGVERPLSREVDFQRFSGRRARIRTAAAIAGQKNFTGRLAGVAEGRVTLEVDDRLVAIPMADIVRARLTAD